ncbi:MAG TPA: DUF4270 family protein [Chitinophagaceae bacterium]|nr:DUF4270 family protein [Chitinophagaceae bacterium]
MKSSILFLSIGSFFLSLFVFFSSCKKINEATELGGKLVPAVDNVHTFEIALNTITRNSLVNDSTQVLYSDLVALGDLNDPEFGHTHAGFDFNVTPSSFGSYPFISQDSLNIDSVVLSLGYITGYGDTLNNGMQTLHVFEIAQNSGFNDSTLYRYNDPASDFAVTGPELGSATFTIRSLKDTITLIRGTDTTQSENVVRIKLDNALAVRFAQFDTTNGYKNDSLFRGLFAGFSVKADPVGNALSYFNLSDPSTTKLTIYYRYGKSDTASFDYLHTVNGQANYINRQNSGNYLTYLNNGAGDKIYLQSGPGSYVTFKIPALDTFSNKVIHRAEILGVKIPSLSDDIFTAPSQLVLDRKNKLTPDTVFMLENDLVADPSGTVGFTAFGGKLLSDNTVRFNISRYVQSIITKHVANDTLRIYAPLRTNLFNSNANTYFSIPGIDGISKGRLVLGGGNNADSTTRLRLRIIYSNL